jgi:hypothetical protein
MSVELMREPTRAVAEEQEIYRAVSPLAVASFILGILSVVALLAWELAIIPAIGFTVGAIACRRIARRPDDLTGRPLALVGMGLAALFWAGGWSRLAIIELTEVPEGYQRVSYDELQPDPAAPTQVYPASATALDGKRIFIKGYMFPGRQTTGITEFVLVRDNGDCCFGGNPKLTDMIQVTLAGAPPAEYSPRVRRVAGTFRLNQGKALDGLRQPIYHLEADYLQ